MINHSKAIIGSILCLLSSSIFADSCPTISDVTNFLTKSQSNNLQGWYFGGNRENSITSVHFHSVQLGSGRAICNYLANGNKVLVFSKSISKVPANLPRAWQQINGSMSCTNNKNLPGPEHCVWW